MTALALRATTRTKLGKGAARKVRAAGNVPAVLYGKGLTPRHLQLNANELRNALRRRDDPDERRVDLTIVEGEREETIRVLLQEVQQDPVTYDILHVDFLRPSDGAANAE
jgi:large subunit ribosomal protein L25